MCQSPEAGLSQGHPEPGTSPGMRNSPPLDCFKPCLMTWLPQGPRTPPVPPAARSRRVPACHVLGAVTPWWRGTAWWGGGVAQPAQPRQMGLAVPVSQGRQASAPAAPASTTIYKRRRLPGNRGGGSLLSAGWRGLAVALPQLPSPRTPRAAAPPEPPICPAPTSILGVGLGWGDLSSGDSHPAPHLCKPGFWGGEGCPSGWLGPSCPLESSWHLGLRAGLWPRLCPPAPTSCGGRETLEAPAGTGSQSRGLGGQPWDRCRDPGSNPDSVLFFLPGSGSASGSRAVTMSLLPVMVFFTVERVTESWASGLCQLKACSLTVGPALTPPLGLSLASCLTGIMTAVASVLPPSGPGQEQAAKCCSVCSNDSLQGREQGGDPGDAWEGRATRADPETTACARSFVLLQHMGGFGTAVPERSVSYWQTEMTFP